MQYLCGIEYLFASAKRTISLFNPSQMNKFENQLGGNQFITNNKDEIDHHLCTFFYYAKNYPEYFLKYCYYLQDYQLSIHLQKIKDLKYEYNKKLLKQYKDTKIHGFSALGASALAHYLSDNNKKYLTTVLLQLGFIATDEDKTIIQLKFHDTLATKHKAIAPFLLCITQKNTFTTLPLEINKIIMHNIIDIEKNQLTNDFYPF